MEVKVLDFHPKLWGQYGGVDTSQTFICQFSALRGRQAGREYYAAMVPFDLLLKLFVFDDKEFTPEFRAQRKLNRARVPEIARYVLNHPSEYVFSALTASIDGHVVFEPATQNGAGRDVGILSVAMTARFIINDGQHRRAAIAQVLRQRPQFASEAICVVLFTDAGLERSQQMFADLNKHAVRPTRSLGVLYDRRDPLSQLARQLTSEVPVFRDLTEMDKATISNRATKLFTLSSIYFATRQLLQKPVRATVSTKESRHAARFWTEVAKNMPDWQSAARGEVSFRAVAARLHPRARRGSTSPRHRRPRADTAIPKRVGRQAQGASAHRLVTEQPVALGRAGDDRRSREQSHEQY